MSSHRVRAPNFNLAVKALLRHVAATMEEFSHVKPGRVLVVAGEARRASRGTIKPLCFTGGKLVSKEGRRKPAVRVKGRRMLYLMTLRPLFFRASTPKERVATVLHELFHISLKFDGTLSGARRHARLGKDFSKRLRPLVRRYLKSCPAALIAPFAHDGEVRVLQWLERPASSYPAGRRGVRRLYTEEQLFYGRVRMLTERTSAAKAPKARIKLH